MTGALPSIAAEGAHDRLCGRPRGRNPYNRREVPAAHAAWDTGWVEFDLLLELRAAKEAARWLREAA